MWLALLVGHRCVVLAYKLLLGCLRILLVSNQALYVVVVLFVQEALLLFDMADFIHVDVCRVEITLALVYLPEQSSKNKPSSIVILQLTINLNY